MTDYQAAYMDAVERCWVRDGDLGLSTRKVDAEVVRALGRTPGWTNIVAAKWSSKAGLLDAVFERAAGDLFRLSSERLGLDAEGSDVERFYTELTARPFLARLVATGVGPEARESDDLGDTRARLGLVLGSAAGVEAFHGLVDGEIAGRWRPTDDERRDALRAVLAMAAEREEAADA